LPGKEYNMAYYDSIDEMYRVYEIFLKRVLSDESVGSKLAKGKVKIRFNYTDPDGTIFLNLAEAGPEGMYGTYKMGPSDDVADVTMTQSSDLAHRFWQGKANAVTSLATGKIKASGAVQKAMGLVTAIRPTFKMYKEVLKETGHEDLIID
jgi:putative sterol carrier protein